MLQSFEDLLAWAETRLSPKDYAVLLVDDPKHHAPGYHSHGVLGHIFAVHQVGQQLTQITGIDIATATLYHDTDKILRFPIVMELASREEGPGHTYTGHEEGSAKVAETEGVDPAIVKIIAIHHYAYRKFTPQDIWNYLGTQKLVEAWMVLCAADAVGKGFPSKQWKQRKNLIPERFEEVARLGGMQTNDKLVQVCCNATKKWKTGSIPAFSKPSSTKL